MPTVQHATTDASTPDSTALNSIRSFSRAKLSALWQRTFGRPLPLQMHHTLAADCLIYQQQVQRVHGVSRNVERALSDLLPSQNPLSTLRPNGPRRFKPGTRLLRTWQGRTYTVTVADPGFLFSGRSYRSLSVIAREITGTPWSGPVFFGLQKRAGKVSHG
jgi:hypothetical protein